MVGRQFISKWSRTRVKTLSMETEPLPCEQNYSAGRAHFWSWTTSGRLCREDSCQSELPRAAASLIYSPFSGRSSCNCTQKCRRLQFAQWESPKPDWALEQWRCVRSVLQSMLTYILFSRKSLHWPRGRDNVFVRTWVVHGQSTSRLGNLLTNVTLVEGIKVNFNVAL